MFSKASPSRNEELEFLSLNTIESQKYMSEGGEHPRPSFPPVSPWGPGRHAPRPSQALKETSTHWTEGRQEWWCHLLQPSEAGSIMGPSQKAVGTAAGSMEPSSDASHAVELLHAAVLAPGWGREGQNWREV